MPNNELDIAGNMIPDGDLLDIGDTGLHTMSMDIPTVLGIQNLEDYVNLVDEVPTNIISKDGLDAVTPNVFLHIVFLEALGYKHSEVAEKTGITYQRLCKIMKTPQFKDLKEAISTQFRALAQNTLSMATVEASKEVINILKRGKNKEKLQAAEIIFDRGGVAKQAQNININQKIENNTVLSEKEMLNVLGMNNPDFLKAVQAREGAVIDVEPNTSGTE